MQQLAGAVGRMGNRHFNFFLVRGTQAALLECGVTAAAAVVRQEWERGEMGTTPPAYLVVMHAHFDHICGLPLLRRTFPAARVLASEYARKVMSRPHVLQGFWDQDAMMTEVLRQQGMVAGEFELERPETLPVDEVLGEGSRLDLGDGRCLQFMHAPGHSPCGLAAYLPSEQVMFPSDAAGFQISEREIFPTYFQGYEMYLETIRRLASFPTRVVAVPHETIWCGAEVEAFYQRALAAAEHAHSWIRQMLEAGTDPESMEEILFEHYYRGDLRIYTPENIRGCVRLLITRTSETL
ncbi:MAG: MBL fold metallo-hydrolase [Syntrophomonadaceae bacterium]|nr:MBL fold metallo-hydrolase [Syntrophomonadaceae bacterium]MDH7497490.1 MBL fold metallo-hydrolase [Syntrophomonadaceae bacterium]